jgi:hypothetical protein
MREDGRSARTREISCACADVVEGMRTAASLRTYPQEPIEELAPAPRRSWARQQEAQATQMQPVNRKLCASAHQL